jgi:hypothetical protein
MRGFSPSSSSLCLVLALSACVRQEDGLTGTSSLRVEIVEPTDLGAPDRPIDGEGVRTVEVSITAITTAGEVDTSFDYSVDLVTQFLGTLSGPAQRISLTEGVGRVRLDLPLAFGPTYLWVEDVQENASGRPPSFATGTSDTIYYRYPYLTDVQSPDLTRTSTRLQRSPLEGKQVEVRGSQFGENGRLVVTWVGTQGFTVSDVSCVDPVVGPCTGVDFGHILVFSFGAPRAGGQDLQVGHVIERIAGGLTEFNGLTELNFPEVELLETAPNPALLPAPVVVDPDWLDSATSDSGMINLERNESGLLAVVDAKVCPLDDEYEEFFQWKVDIGNGCGNGAMNIVTQGAVEGFDPATVVGDTLPQVVGALRAVNIGSFHVWIMQPRNAADLTF